MTDATTLDAATLDALERKAKAATSGAWTHEPHGRTTALYSGRNEIVGEAFGHPMRGHGLRLMNLDDGDANFAANVDHITAFDPPTALALIAAARERDALRALLGEFSTHPNWSLAFVGKMYGDDDEPVTDRAERMT